MITKIKSDRILSQSGIFDGYVYTENGKIVAVTRDELPFDTELDFTGKYVSPGFIEIHCHGGAGHPFLNCTADDVTEAANFHFTHGVTSICPTVSAAPISEMRKAAASVSEAKKSDKTKPHIIGAHLEGPYISAKQAGAQCPDFITPPIEADYRDIISAFGKDIVRWTYAPENDTDGVFGRYLKESHILASAGHTDAVQADIEMAMESGCKLITHLYSCTSTVTRKFGFRSLGVIETAYLHDDMWVEIIADGKHLPPELIKLIIKIKGIDRVIAVTDCLDITGTDVKNGVMSGVPFIVEEGVCRLADRSAFAGSIATSERLVRVLTREVGLSISDAVKSLTENPAKLLGLNKGVIAPGYDADIIVFDDDINVENVFVG